MLKLSEPDQGVLNIHGFLINSGSWATTDYLVQNILQEMLMLTIQPNRAYDG